MMKFSPNLQFFFLMSSLREVLNQGGVVGPGPDYLGPFSHLGQGLNQKCQITHHFLIENFLQNNGEYFTRF